MKSVPPTHKFKSRKEWENCVWETIVSSLADYSSLKDVEKFLAMLVTAHEREQIIKRAATVSLIKQGKSYREIGDILWLSHPTISSVKNSMTAGGYVSYYERSKNNKKKVRQEKPKLQFSELLDRIFEVPPPPRQGRRIPPGEWRVIPSHGKLAHSWRVRI